MVFWVVAGVLLGVARVLLRCSGWLIWGCQGVLSGC